MPLTSGFAVPAAYNELVESAGGFLLEADPPLDVKGWVVAVGFYRALDPARIETAEFLFTEKEQAERFVRTSPSSYGGSYDGWQVGAVSLGDTRTYFHCAFCLKRRRDVGHLFHAPVGAAICDACVRELAGTLARR